eukprot:TRINITY_DN7997_c0_g1_i1.p2 TRINITY_DN7997_c0_g1~~TRINITY_DN7997_c0_g1_i1.p2  ORF type:complete len:238 (-),score=45.32 TRINITY_DN7997_c0_g1_i1:212-925(-)
MSCLGCLKCVLKVSNYILLIGGLCLLGFGIYMFVGWHDTGRGPLSQTPWFIATVTGLGLFVCLTAVVGITGADCVEKPCCVNLYVLMAIVLLMAQVGIVVAVFVKDTHIPPDASGNLVKIKNFIKSNMHIVKISVLCALVMQTVAVVTACLISVKEDQKKDAEDDEISAFLNPVFSKMRSHNNRSLTSQKTDVWSRHMKAKYRLDTSKFSYDPERQRMSAEQDEELLPNAKKACTIM